MHPTNAVICIVGDVEIEDVKKLIQQILWRLIVVKIVKKAYATELSRKKRKKYRIEKDSQSDYVSLTYVIPKVAPRVLYFDVLSKI